MKANKDPSLIS